MSSIINKVKDAVTGHSHSHPNDPNTASTNHGPHNTNVANKADPLVDSDLDGRSGLGNYSKSTNAGPHDSNIANKLDPRVDSDRDGSSKLGATGTTTTHGTHTGTGFGSTTTGTTHHTAGPHNSDLLNKADPRVDSDRDGSRNYGAATGTTGASAYGNTGYSGTGTHTGTHTGTSHTAGPHNSDLLNKADPRVDSDRDGSRNYGAATGNTGASAYSSGTTGLSGATHGTHTGTHTGSTNTAGPHNSDLLNKVDPRVDSDRDGSRNFGAATGNTGASAYSSGATGLSGTHGATGSTGLTGSHGTHGTTGLTGTHASHGTSGLSGTHDTHGTTGLSGNHGTHGTTGLTGGTHGTHGTHHSGPGPAPNTAGPHNSDLLNKVDPRVDSDRDGSKTIGGDRTYA